MSPSAEAEAVLRALQVRLDHSPEEAFTREALTQRADLLRLSADLLADKERREDYESALLGGALGLELSSNKEIGGLILLLEANAAYEAFKLASDALQPPQAPALGSSREADLTLLASLACRAASLQEQEDRHYESAAELLREGIKLLQRMGKLPDQRKLFKEELNALLPYRILDLVSRDLGEQSLRKEGLKLLNDFVLQRGGLEGGRGFKDQSGLEQAEFEIFFQQIRGFLTAQEQIDLYTHWKKKGSKDAEILCVLSLAAAGFSCRKPERVWEARKNLERLNLDGVDSLPLLGSLDLLLADVDSASNRFLASPDSVLQDWLKNYPTDKLAAFCDYCRDWLRRDVLPGYRDVNANSVDLEAWFADRDVQEFVERLDRKGVRGKAFSFLSSITPDVFPSSITEAEEQSLKEVSEDLEKEAPEETVKNISSDLSGKETNSFPVFRAMQGGLKESFRNLYLMRRGIRLGVFFLIAFMGISGAFALLSQRYRFSNFQMQQLPRSQDASKENLLEEDKNDIKLREKSIKENLDFKLLTIDKPNKKQLRTLIESWLIGKSSILAGNEDILLSRVARPNLVKRVKEQRKKDLKASNKQDIRAKIISLKIVSRTSRRIEIATVIAYTDKKYNSKGRIISETNIPKLNVTYILGKDPDAWRMQAYLSGG
ncbi:IMS domain-containing protein [Prochlorococcus sp. MIT 1341]|uniref:IMS domain-containing protein n=1 Tax=Prochlorococcus sp. MIT 1341 TaxID=3096221 RepID=UPI002A74F2AA|nr:IMS domain-containing protein [Prochlorococcus sp. MIT 1341]